MTTMPHNERFFRTTLAVTAPLILWAVHFFITYIYAEAACHSQAFLNIVSVMALLAGAFLLLRACRRQPRTLAGVAGQCCALLGLAGIAANTVPILLLPIC